MFNLTTITRCLNRNLATGAMLGLLVCGASAVDANAQFGGYYDPYERNGRYEQRGRRDNRYYGASLRDAARRIEKNSDRLEDRIDDALDRSRYNGSRREDRINNIADDFEKTADQLNDRIGNGDNRRLEQARPTAERLLQLGSQLDRFFYNARLDGNTEQLWNQIRNDLNVISDAYGYRNSYDPNRRGRYDDRYDDRYDPRQNRRRDNRRRAGDIIGGILGYPN